MDSEEEAAQEFVSNYIGDKGNRLPSEIVIVKDEYHLTDPTRFLVSLVPNVERI